MHTVWSVLLLTQTANSFPLPFLFSSFEGNLPGFFIVSIILSSGWLFAPLWPFVVKLAHFIFTCGDLQDHGAQHQCRYSLSEPQQPMRRSEVTSPLWSPPQSLDVARKKLWRSCECMTSTDSRE